jgi:hypothetical protein
MKQKTLEFSYLVDDIINSRHVLFLDKAIPNPNPTTEISLPTNAISQSYATLFYGVFEVGNIFYYANRISQKDKSGIIVNQFFENVVIKLHPSPCFELDTFVSGQIISTLSSVIFDNNKKYSFNGISTGGSFTGKNIDVSIFTDNTPIRKVIININEPN